MTDYGDDGTWIVGVDFPESVLSQREQEVREKLAAEIEREADQLDPYDDRFRVDGMRRAAEIVRGDDGRS